MENKKIFFSYSRTDGSDFALRLASDLKKEGFNIWIDQKDIRAGSEWDIEIEKALETCDILLFIESEQSVISNNVLDEVYYALEQNKKVIPVILHDSKTPFRLQRLQHIDFSKDYDAGLTNLIKELRGKSVSEFFQTSNTNYHGQSGRISISKSTLVVISVSIAVIIILSIVFYSARQKKNLVREEAGVIQRVESSDRKETPGEVEPVDTATRTGIPTVTDKRRSSSETAELSEAVLGTWQLVSVDPEVTSHKGYLKIDATADRRVTVKSFFQFYYPKSEDTAFLTIFNGFAGCTSCLLNKEVKLTTEDVSIGTQHYSILRSDRPGIGKAGDTIANRGGNQSIRASSVLYLPDQTTALIKVKRNEPVELSQGLKLKPFEYTFRFKKAD